MADIDKEKIEESMDDSVFSMYSEWIESGYADAGETGYEQEMPAPPASETAAGRETVGSLGAKCEKLRQELAEAEKRLQVLNEAQEADFLKSQGETVTGSEKKQEKPRNPFETLARIVEKNAPEEAATLKEVQQYMEEMLAEHPDGSGLGRKEALPPQDKENTIIKMLKAPYTHYRDRHQKMAYKAEKRISRLEKLEQKAAQARSTLGKLSDYKKEASARDAEKKEAQGKENIRKEPEMAI